MPQFLLGYYDGQQPATPEEGEQHMQEWKNWAAALGSALINPGTPVGITKVLTPNGVSDQPSPYPIMGFSILDAENMDAALKLVENCPHIKYGGTLEVSEMMAMPAS